MRLINKNVVEACFPLHEGRHDVNGPQGEKSDRRLLFMEWAHWKNFYKVQPLWLVKRYFGDKVCIEDWIKVIEVIFKIGLYFAWLGFYNQMLIFPALFGLFVFLYGIVTMNMKTVNYPGSEVCHNETMKSTVLCPECPENCDFRSELETNPEQYFNIRFISGVWAPPVSSI